jgi:long-chain acyl-CoA synthetase
MREYLATLVDDFRRFDREIAVVRYQGNRRRVTTYGELARLAGRFAALLAGRGIGQGDRVLLWAENSAEWIAAFHGCLLRGVLAVPLDAGGTADFAARVAADVNPKLAVGDTMLLRKLTAADGASNIPTLAFEYWLNDLPAEELGAIPDLSNQTPLQVLFTSGTTGDPKGIVITHGNVLASVGPIEDGARPYMRYERLVHPLRILHTLPLSHVFGQTMGLWVPPIFRGELHFESRLAAPRLVEIIHDERISVLAAVPRVLALLKTHLEMIHEGIAERVASTQNKKNPLHLWWRFRKVHQEFGIKFWAFVSGGGALPPQIEQFWNTLGFVLVQGYGMTETTALITLNHPFHVAEGTIGKPLSGREVKLGPDGEVMVRGAAISGAIWHDGKLQPRQEEWLATGDIAERDDEGDLRFLGRKSEVIVTASGLNLYPEDIEAAIEAQPEVAACAVVPLQTEAGPEPCAVLALRGSGENAAAVIERANAKLAEFQRIRRWVLWPEPDLPRTSTGKVKRKPVAAWLNSIQASAGATGNGSAHRASGALSTPSADWLLALVAQVSGETPPGTGDELRLTEDFHLDSLGRMQLAAAIEDRLGIVQSNGLLENVQTLGELRKLVAGGERDESEPNAAGPVSHPETGGAVLTPGAADGGVPEAPVAPFAERQSISAPPRRRFLYPEWPWWKPFVWIRNAYIEVIARPFTWLLTKPRVFLPSAAASGQPPPQGPMLIISNHVTSYDGALIQYAMPGPLRRRLAIAMAGEMLEDFRHWRNPWRMPVDARFYIFGLPSYFLVTALYNVFPLPKQRDFQSSFMHAGKALDHGYNVLIFPEGNLSEEGKLARFRAGIGLLTKESSVPVLPIAIRGLGELKTHQRSWIRSGTIEVHIGEPITFGPEETEAAITARLHDEVERLLAGG